MDSSDEYLYNGRLIDLFSFFFENLYIYALSLARTCALAFRSFLEMSQISELIDAVGDKLSEYPALRLVAFSTAVSCSIPILLFIVFALMSVAVTFAGFLFIEGALLAIGGLVMFTFLILIIMIISIMTLTGGAFYILVGKLGVIFNKFEYTSNLLRSMAPPPRNQHVLTLSNSLAHAHQH